MRLGEIVTREATRNPRKTAVIDAVLGRGQTYRELDRRVSALAARLAREPGVRGGDRVAVLALNRMEYVEAYLAAARAGLIAQGVNWRLATDELVRTVQDGRPRVLICESEFAEVADEIRRRVDIPVLLLFGEGSDGSYEDFVLSGEGLPVQPAGGADDDPVLIIYTGGTTGDPKGAVHTNRSCMAAMVNNTVAERILPTDRYLLLGQMFHSASVLALNYLMHGATLVLAPKFEPRLALETIEAEQVTASLAFPAMIQYMLAAAGVGTYDLGTLRNMQYGGGPLAASVINAMMDALPCTLIQCYGSTEHIGVTFLSQEDHMAARSGKPHLLRSCGREAHLTRVRLLDERGNMVPRDGRTPGEIVVSAPASMSGYWKRPELTEAARRGPHGFGTGDLAVWDDDGYLYIVDRAKDMIISGGENIYPAQIENVIADHPSVLEVAVVGLPDEVWGEAVTAFVVLKEGRQATVDELREAVRTRLGSYQKPKAVHFIAELPKAPTGKVAKHLLMKGAPYDSPRP